MTMTTNSNTADDAIFDNDSDVTDIDTGAVGVAAVRTPTAPVPDCACWAMWPTIRAPSRCPRRRWRGSRARPPQGATFFELRAAVDDFDLRGEPRAPPSSTRPAESPPTADRQSLRAHAPHWNQPPPNSGSFSRRWQRLKRTLELA